MENSPVQAKRERVSKFAGAGALVQGLGLVAPFLLYPLLGDLGAVIGVVLLVIMFLVGSSMSLSWRCGACKNPVASKDVLICPACKASLR